MKFQNVFRNAMQNGAGRIKVMRGNVQLTVGTAKGIDYMPNPMDERLCGVRLSDIEGYARLKFKLRQQKGVVVTKVLKGRPGRAIRPAGRRRYREDQQHAVTDKDRFTGLMVEGLRRNYILYQVKRNDDIFFLPMKLDTLL